MDKLLRNKKAIIFFIASAFLLFTFVLFVPICQSVFYSLCNYDALSKPDFIGFENYKQLLFNDKTMRIALKNSIFFMVFSCVSQLIMGLLLAAFLTNIQKGRNCLLFAVCAFFRCTRTFVDVHFQSEAWYQSGSCNLGDQRTVVADGCNRLYQSADEGHCICGIVAVCWTVHDALYGTDLRY